MKLLLVEEEVRTVVGCLAAPGGWRLALTCCLLETPNLKPQKQKRRKEGRKREFFSACFAAHRLFLSGSEGGRGVESDVTEKDRR